MDRSKEDWIALLACGVFCAAVILGYVTIFDGCRGPNIDIKKHIPVSVTVEYR